MSPRGVHMKKIKCIHAAVFMLLTMSFSLFSCSHGSDDGGSSTPTTTETIGGIEVPITDKNKSSTVLINEGYSALNSGDYDTTLSKFRSAYALDPNDTTKIYYALTELAMLSTDTDVVDIIKNDFGAKNYPATPNAIFNSAWVSEIKTPVSKLNSVFNSEWLKKYPELKNVNAATFEPNAEGNYIRVSATPTNSWSNNVLAWDSYYLHDGTWVYYPDYIKTMDKTTLFLTNVTPDANGNYLIPFSSCYSSLTDKTAYETQANSEIADYLYNVSSYTPGQLTKTTEGQYVRLTGTETTSYNTDYMYYSYKNNDGTWTRSYGNIINYSLSNEGNYLASKSDIVLKLAQKKAKASLTSYLYNSTSSYRKNILGEILYLPELAVPDWVTSSQYYKNTIVGTTQSYKTWLYLIYANLITNNEQGANEKIDKLIKIVHAKNETIRKIVDSMGTGTTTLDPTFIRNLRLTEYIGDDSVTISKTEMQILSAALEACDAALTFVASYDLSADLKCAEISLEASPAENNAEKDKIVKAINDSVTAKTLSVRDATKLAAAKTMFSEAAGRVISCYNEIKTSTLYPQIVKDKIAEYGAAYYDGAVKAKAALDNGSIFYIPKEPNPRTFPTTASEAFFGIDLGKVFTPGYFTNIIERSTDKEKVKIYYKRFEETTGWNGSSLINNHSESEFTELTGSISNFATTVANDAGLTVTLTSSPSYSYTRKEIWYEVGILINKDIITQALPGIEGAENQFDTITSAKIDKTRFIKIFDFHGSTTMVNN